MHSSRIEPLTAIALRVVIPIVFVAVAAVAAAGFVSAQPPPTRVITAVPVGPTAWFAGDFVPV